MASHTQQVLSYVLTIQADRRSIFEAFEDPWERLPRLLGRVVPPGLPRPRPSSGVALAVTRAQPPRHLEFQVHLRTERLLAGSVDLEVSPSGLGCEAHLTVVASATLAPRFLAHHPLTALHDDLRALKHELEATHDADRATHPLHLGGVLAPAALPQPA